MPNCHVWAPVTALPVLHQLADTLRHLSILQLTLRWSVQLQYSRAVSFACGALTYSSVVGCCYVVNALTSASEASHRAEVKAKAAQDESEKHVANSIWPSKEDLSVCALFTWQGAQKMLLQEASRSVLSACVVVLLPDVLRETKGWLVVSCVVLVTFHTCCRIALSTYSARATGVYGEVQNLASVVVRLVFWPVENAAFRSFSDTGTGETEETQAQKHRHLPQLQLLLRAVLLAALLACSFGPSYAFAAIHVLLSHSWSSTDAPTVLAAYTAFLLCLAVNGVLEAYIHARMSAKELMLSNGLMVAIVLMQAGCIAFAKQLGESGVALVVIECFSMLLRIVTALWFVMRWHRQYAGPKLAWMPSVGTLLVLAGAAFVTHLSNERMLSRLGQGDLQQRLPWPLLEHVAVGGVMLGGVILSWLQFEADALKSIRSKTKEHEE